jgi:hypothetical protein
MGLVSIPPMYELETLWIQNWQRKTRVLVVPLLVTSHSDGHKGLCSNASIDITVLTFAVKCSQPPPPPRYSATVYVHGNL